MTPSTTVNTSIASSTSVIDTVTQNLVARGYRPAATKAEADLAVEIVYLRTGSARLESSFGVLDCTAGDYVVVPKGTTHRVVPSTTDNFFLLISGAARHDQTCPGEMSKTFRLARLAREVVEASDVTRHVVIESASGKVVAEGGDAFEACVAAVKSGAFTTLGVLLSAAPLTTAVLLATLAQRWAPDGDPAYVHDTEGDDDMAAHARSILSGSSRKRSSGLPTKTIRPSRQSTSAPWIRRTRRCSAPRRGAEPSGVATSERSFDRSLACRHRVIANEGFFIVLVGSRAEPLPGDLVDLG